MIARLLQTLTVLALVAPVGAAGAVQRSTEGELIEAVFRHAAGERTYFLRLPDTVARGLPLVVLLHGCTQDARDLMRGSRFNELAQARGVALLYIQQPASAHPNKCWNWYDPAHQARDAGEPALIADLTRRIVREHGLDTSRVYIAGISAGAAMASLVAVAYPDIYAAVALHSGLVHTAAATLGDALRVMKEGVEDPLAAARRAHDAMGARIRAIPALVIHGDADAVLLPVNGEQTLTQWAETNRLALRAAKVTTERRDIAAADGQRAYTDVRALDETGRELARAVIVHGLGHAWSGGSPEGTFTDARGPRASQLMLDFLLQQRHP